MRAYPISALATGAALLVLLLSPFSAAQAAPPFSGPTVTGHLTDPTLTEASGLAVSQRDPGFLWAVNDSGNGPLLHLFETDGTGRGYVRVTDLPNRDWEDLASFTLDGKPYLLIADTGDNLAFRSTCTLAIVEEPALPDNGTELDSTVAVAWSVRFQYEDGPRDCEAVAVDVQAGKILLVSKREPVPRLYELPLKSRDASETLVAKYLGPVILGENRPVPEDKRKPTPYAWQPTAMDIAADGSMAVFSTYRFALVFPRKPGQTWAQAFSQAPNILNPHGLNGCEDIALSPDAKRLYLTSEGEKAPVLRYDRANGQ